MDSDSPDAEEFFEGLAGRRPSDKSAGALSEALRAQVRTERRAEEASATDWTPQEAAQMDALRKCLTASGVLPAAAKKAPPALGWATRLQHLLLGENVSFARTFAVAAGVVMATIVVLKMAPDAGPDPSTVLRGTSTHEIRVADPAVTANTLEADLRTAGADVLAAQINTDEWSVLVRSVPQASAASVNERLRQAGFALEGAPPYELTVRRISP